MDSLISKSNLQEFFQGQPSRSDTSKIMQPAPNYRSLAWLWARIDDVLFRSITDWVYKHLDLNKIENLSKSGVVVYPVTLLLAASILDLSDLADISNLLSGKLDQIDSFSKVKLTKYQSKVSEQINGYACHSNGMTCIITTDRVYIKGDELRSLNLDNNYISVRSFANGQTFWCYVNPMNRRILDVQTYKYIPQPVSEAINHYYNIAKTYLTMQSRNQKIATEFRIKPLSSQVYSRLMAIERSVSDQNDERDGSKAILPMNTLLFTYISGIAKKPQNFIELLSTLSRDDLITVYNFIDAIVKRISGLPLTNRKGIQQDSPLVTEYIERTKDASICNADRIKNKTDVIKKKKASENVKNTRMTSSSTIATRTERKTGTSLLSSKTTELSSNSEASEDDSGSEELSEDEKTVHETIKRLKERKDRYSKLNVNIERKNSETGERMERAKQEDESTNSNNQVRSRKSRK